MKMCYYLDEKICRLTQVKPDKSFRLGKAIIFQRARIDFEKLPEHVMRFVVYITSPFNKALNADRTHCVRAAG